MASVYGTILDALLRGEVVTLHRNADDKPPRAQTVRQKISENYTAYKRAMASHGIRVQEQRLQITTLDGGALELRFVLYAPATPTFTTRSAQEETEHEQAARIAELAKGYRPDVAIIDDPHRDELHGL